MSQFGRILLPGTTPLMTMVNADGFPNWKTGGITLDPTLIAAAPGSDVTLPDGTVIKAGSSQYLRFGQIVCAVQGTNTQLLTLTGAPTGGTFNVTYGGQTTAAVAYNASAATLQTALNALGELAQNAVTVAGSAGGPYTVSFPAGYSAQFFTVTPSNYAALTGGTNPTLTVSQTITSADSTAGKYGPYDPAASDGRQSLVRGYCGILNETWMASPAGSSFGAIGTLNPPVMIGGRSWRDRILMTSGTHSLAVGPTITEFEAAFPLITYANSY